MALESYGQSFNKHHIITSGSLPVDIDCIETADINNDGHLDILACGMWSDYIYFLENKGNEEFKILQKLIRVTGAELDQIKTSDINNDGLLDIVYSEYNYLNQLSWLKNLGNNEFVRTGTIFSEISGWRSPTFVLHDLNGDDYDDVVLSFCNQDCRLIYKLNEGNETFSALMSVFTDGEVVDFSCVDIDNDSDIDILYTTKNPYQVAIAVNDGSGSFTNNIVLETSYDDSFVEFRSFDTDGDSDYDILGYCPNYSISLLVNNGGLDFNQILISNDSLFSLNFSDTLDIDNDGDLDLFNRASMVLLNTGNNSFEYHDDTTFKQYIGDYNIVDLNKNGVKDLIYDARYFVGSIAYIEDISLYDNSEYRILTSQLYRPMCPAFGNVNNDDFPDICIHDSRYKYVFYLNNGQGKFSDTLTTNLPHRHSRESAFFDINKDGFLDIISYDDYGYTGFNDSININILRNKLDNTFTTACNTDLNQEDCYMHFYDYKSDTALNGFLFHADSEDNVDSIFIYNINSDFSISIYDTISFNAKRKIRKSKFYDISGNGENDYIFNDNDGVYIIYSKNNRFPNILDTIIADTDKIIFDFLITDINNNPQQDILIIRADKLRVYEDFDGVTFARIYDLDAILNSRLIYGSDLNLDGLEEIIVVGEEKIRLFTEIDSTSYQFEDFHCNINPIYYSDYNPLVFADIDLDGSTDLLSTYYRESDLSWFENSYIDTSGYMPFPEDNAIWTEQNTGKFTNTIENWTSLFVSETDTSIFNNAWKNIYEYFLDSITRDTIRQLYASIRQEISEKKVYIIRHYLAEYNEKLLLDFNIYQGDTVILDAYFWETHSNSTDSLFIVDSIETGTLFNSEKRSVYFLSNHKELHPVSLTIIEGIGSLQNPFGPAVNDVNFNNKNAENLCCPVNLLCLSINNQLIYVKEDVTKCNVLEATFHIESFKQDQAFTIFPNPVKDKLYIDFKEIPMSSLKIDIFNTMGARIGNFSYGSSENTITINVDGLTPGLYFLRIKHGNSKHTAKFIVTDS